LGFCKGSIGLREHIATMIFVCVYLATLPLFVMGQFGDYKPPAPRCAPFTCPAGEKPMRKKGYKTWSYGCPDSGANVFNMASLDTNNPLAGMKNQKSFDKCCLEHDACLQTCGMTSVACHEVYEKCAAKVCRGDKNCGFQGQLAQMMNSPYSADYSKMGKDDEKKSDPLCTSYDRLQAESCECVAEDAWQDALEKRLKTFYKKFNKEKLGTDGEIKDLKQVKAKWGGKESEMFLELTKKYKDKAIEKRVKPKPPPYTPPEKDAATDTDTNQDDGGSKDAAVEADSEEASFDTTSSSFQTSLKALQAKKAKAVKDEDYDAADTLVEEIKDLKKEELTRLRAEKKQAVEDEDFLKAKSIKQAIDALDPKQEL